MTGVQTCALPILCVQNKVLADRNKIRSGRLVEELLKEAGESRCGHE